MEDKEMKNNLVVVKGMNLEEQRRRNSFNRVFETMRKRNMFTENNVKNYLLNQTSLETFGGYLLTYEEALNYFNEMTK